jgi:hypothetical protein
MQSSLLPEKFKDDLVQGGKRNAIQKLPMNRLEIIT